MHDKAILIGYDGFEGAKRAIGFAGKYFAGRRAVVITASEVNASGRGADDPVDQATRATTEATAEEGAALAREVGIDAEARTVYASEKPWQSLIEVADDIEAGLVVVGSHGLNGARPLVLGSVSHQLGHLARQPVVAVPTPDAIAARREQKAKTDASGHVH